MMSLDSLDAKLREANVLLARFLECQDETQADKLLDRLLTEHCLPMSRGILSRKSLDPAEAEQVTGLACGSIVQHLQKARTERIPNPVQHFKAYVRLMTERAFGDFLDDKYPERRRLKQRILYVVRSQNPAQKWLASWPNSKGRTVFGLTAWQGQEPSPNERAALLREDPCAAADRALPNEDPTHAPLATLVAGLLVWTGQPVELEELVNGIGRIRGIRDVQTLAVSQHRNDDSPRDRYDETPDTTQNIERDTEQRDLLAKVWAEICRLQVSQRMVLLLGMKDDTGGSPLDLLVSQRVVGLRQIAAQLEMQWNDFARVWQEIPLDDRRLAGMLHISEENVRFKRHAARARLRQRMAAQME